MSKANGNWLPWGFLALGLGVANAMPAHGAMLTYDLRAMSISGPGMVAADGKSVGGVAPGSVVTLGLFAQVANLDGNHANDGFLAGQGSFLAAMNAQRPGLTGHFRGDTGVITRQNNVAPFDSSLFAASGTQQDLNGDGGLDAGSLLTTGGVFGDWFVASNGSSSPTLGTGLGEGTTDFLIGQITYTILAVPPQSVTDLNFVVRIKLDGTVGSRSTHVFQTDGMQLSLPGSNADLAVGAPVSIVTVVPEPATLGFIAAGAMMLMRSRRR